METFSQALIFGASNGMNLAAVAVGLTLIFGVYKTLNLAHGQAFMLGAFFTYVFATQLGWPFFAAMLVAMVATGILGMLIEVAVFRHLRDRPLDDQLLASLGLFIVLGTIALRIWGDFEARPIDMPGEGSAVTLLGVGVDVSRLVIIGVTMLLFLGLYVVVYRTHLGRMMRAMAQNEEAATLMGVPTTWIASITFFIGTALGGAAGALLGALFNARPDMGFGPLLLALVIVIFGGLGSIAGSFVAAMIIGLLQTFGVFYLSSTAGDLLPFIVLLLVLLLRPQGLFGVKVERA